MGIRPRKLSRSNPLFSCTRTDVSLPRSLRPAFATTRMWVWASRPLRLPSKENTSIRSALSPVTSASEDASFVVSLLPPRWTRPSCAKELPSLLEEVQPLREASHQHCCSLVSLLPHQGRRYCHHRTMPPPFQDRSFQRS